MEFTGVQIGILLKLSSMEGLSNKQLAERLGKKKENLVGPLQKLKELGVIIEGDPRWSIEGKKYREIPYCIKLDYPIESKMELQFFDIIIKILIEMNNEETISSLLNSNYTNKLVKKFKFMPLCNILEKYAENKNYNKTITKSMLSWSEVKNEIMRYQDIIKERADFCKAPTIAFALPQNNLIGSLRNFNSIDAVRFYRNTISDTYSKLLRYREEEFLTESLKEFLDLDIYLSPFTSYPINNPIQLLFTRPFERLYNNAYLIDESDYERFIQRAYIVYSHFGQILGKGMRYLLWERDSHVEIVINNLDKPKEVIDQEYLEQLDFPTRNYIPDEMNFGGTLDTILKTSIFYWNIASYRMDTLCKMLINYTKDFNGSRKFRIFSDDAGLNVIDLETDKRIIDSKESSELNGTYFLIDVMLENSKDPFIDFRPCDVFKEVGLKAEIKGYGDLYEALDRNFDYGIGYE